MYKKTITERVDNITGMTAEYSSVTPPAPKSVKIEITGRCNFRCTFCGHNQRLREVGDIDPVFYKRIVKEMREAGVQELGVFYLGESFLNPFLPEAIRYAKEDCGYEYVFLTTNGSISTPEKLEACFKAGLNSLKFSINYANEEQFTRIANVKASYFPEILKNLKEARRIRDNGKYDCGIYASYIQYNQDQDTVMKDYLEEVRPYVDELYPLPLYNQAALVENDKWKFVQGNRGRLDNLRDSLPCWSIFTEGHVSFDGRLSACCFDHDHRFSMGDLNTTPFMEAWNSRKFVELRGKHLQKNVEGTICEKCVAYS